MMSKESTRATTAPDKSAAQKMYESWRHRQENRMFVPPWHRATPEARAEWEAMAAQPSPSTGGEPATDSTGLSKLQSRLIEMSDIIREGSRWNGNEQEFREMSESDVAMLDDILSDAIRLAAREPAPVARELDEEHVADCWRLAAGDWRKFARDIERRAIRARATAESAPASAAPISHDSQGNPQYARETKPSLAVEWVNAAIGYVELGHLDLLAKNVRVGAYVKIYSRPFGVHRPTEPVFASPPAPARGVSDPTLLAIAARVRLEGDADKLIAYARGVLAEVARPSAMQPPVPVIRIPPD